MALASRGVSLPPGGMFSVMQGEVTINTPHPRGGAWDSGLELFPGFQSWRDLGCFSLILSNIPEQVLPLPS